MIHPTAIVDYKAKIGKNVKIYPFTVIEDAVIGDNSIIRTGAVIKKYSTLGINNEIGEYSVIGGNPQDISFNPKTKTGVDIGNHNVIREYVTIHRATQENKNTILGNHNFIMAYAHLAHDNLIHNNIIIVNGTQLAGWVEVRDNAFISSEVGVHQFVKIGENVMIAAGTKLRKDAPPFSLVEGYPGKFCGLNIVGMRRRNITASTRMEIKEFYKLFYKTISIKKNLTLIKKLNLTVIQKKILAFVEEKSIRGIITHKKKLHL